jgi:hypothetical protein
MRRGWNVFLMVGVVVTLIASLAYAAEEKEGARFEYRLEYLFSVTAKLVPEPIGPLPEGFRINLYVTGGEVSGPKVRGKVRVGGDWLTLQTDGVGNIDVRATIETEDGALIYATYTGVADMGEDGYQMVLQRKPRPRFTPLRMAARYRSAHLTIDGSTACSA